MTAPNVRPDLAEWIDAAGLPCDARDARIVAGPCDGVAAIAMDDDGYGECYRTVTDREAGLLIAAGLVRDAR